MARVLQIQDVGDSFSEAFNVRLKRGTVTLENSLNQDDQLDFYRIRLSGRSSLNCVLNELDEDADLTLFDSQGLEITESDEDDEDPEVIRRLLPGGTYFVRVNRIDGDNDYRIRFSINQDPGDNFGKASRIQIRQNQLQGDFIFQDSIGRVDDEDDPVDFYRIKLSDRSAFNCQLNGLQTNADLTLFNSRRRQIAVSAKEGRQSESIDEILKAGVYFLRVNVRGRRSTDYRLGCSFRSLTADLGGADLGGNTIDTANPITINANDTHS
jgi:hypothetical protein